MMQRAKIKRVKGTQTRAWEELPLNMRITGSSGSHPKSQGCWDDKL